MDVSYAAGEDGDGSWLGGLSRQWARTCWPNIGRRGGRLSEKVNSTSIIDI